MTSTRQQAADLYHQLYLERQHLRADVSYSLATSFCYDCPHKNWDDYIPQSYSEIEFGIHIADTCCQEDPDYWAAETAQDNFLTKLMEDLKTFVGDEELEAARARLGKSEAIAKARA